MHLRKKLVVATAVTASLALGGAAYAYWTTTTGSGTGSGRTTATASGLSASGTMATALSPGGTATLRVAISNPTELNLAFTGSVSAHAKVVDSEGVAVAVPDGVEAAPLDCGITVTSVDGVTTGLIGPGGNASNPVSLTMTWANLPDVDQTPCLDHAIAFDITLTPTP